MQIEVPEGYEALADVLALAIEQAAYGKGKERHANGEPFDQQKICRISRSMGCGFALGQAIKKIEEAARLDGPAAMAELLGAINYTAAGGIVLAEERGVELRAQATQDQGDHATGGAMAPHALGNAARCSRGCDLDKW